MAHGFYAVADVRTPEQVMKAGEQRLHVERFYQQEANALTYMRSLMVEYGLVVTRWEADNLTLSQPGDDAACFIMTHHEFYDWS